ncbi:MAG: hypothetical protein AseanaTS_15450 [Candidatus Pelagadaptatus aseana]|uniref:GGDEF domain-containing protein n=1 Tax=Candidatus Pelagadaptatus aseana TaxID=3120508 RepID=UPI0039B2E45A
MTVITASLVFDAPWVIYEYPQSTVIRFLSASWLLTVLCLAKDYSSNESLTTMDTLRSDLSTAANTDSLTRLFNRRYITENFIHHDRFTDNIRNNGSVLLADIDHFKQVNDSYGHDAGDQVLKMVADALRDTTRSDDILARWGGEEFLIILPGIPEEVAIKRAQQFIDRIAGETLYLDNGILKVTLSMGISRMENDKSANATLKEADEYLYQAKEGGRNQICFRNPPA